MGQIIRIGLPSACETAIHNVSMTLVIRFLNQMDAQGLNVTARSYTMQITNFSYCRCGTCTGKCNYDGMAYRCERV